MYPRRVRVAFGLRRIWPTYPAILGLLSGSCSSGPRFASGFLQIPPRDGHPCPRAFRFGATTSAREGLSLQTRGMPGTPTGRRGARAPRPPTPPDVRVSYPAVPLSFVAPNTSAPRLDSPPTPTTLAAPLWAQIGFRPLRLPRGAPRQLELARRVFSCGPTHIESSGLLPAPRGFALPGTSRPGTMASADSSRPIQRHC